MTTGTFGPESTIKERDLFKKAYSELEEAVTQFNITVRAGAGASSDRFLEREKRRIATELQAALVRLSRTKARLA